MKSLSLWRNLILTKTRSFFRWVLIAAGIFSISVFSKKQTDGFTIAKITSDLSYYPDWETKEILGDEEVRSILSKPFYYLNKGAQVFAFESEDGRYVLKFFRHDHMRPRFWLSHLPLKGHQRRIEKLHETFSSYRLASEAFREEAGIIFLHLNKTHSLHKTIEIIDKIGIHHQLQADDIEFVIQKKADLLYPTLQRWISDGKSEEVRHALSSVVSYLKKRCHRSIFDKDPNLETNFGIADGKLLQIDVGRFHSRHPYTQEESKDELIRATDHLYHFLLEKSPEFGTYLREQIES